MSNSPDRRVPSTEQLRRIRCLLTDVDGVLTDGRIHLNEAGEESKIFHVHDAAGLVYWHRAGGMSGFVSGRLGKMVEKAETEELLANPLHPYTQALLQSLPGTVAPGQQLNVIQGTVPTPREFPAGCRFATRCTEVLARCASQVPPASRHDATHFFSCWRRMESPS